MKFKLGLIVDGIQLVEILPVLNSNNVLFTIENVNDDAPLSKPEIKIEPKAEPRKRNYTRGRKHNPWTRSMQTILNAAPNAGDILTYTQLRLYMGEAGFSPQTGSSVMSLLTKTGYFVPVARGQHKRTEKPLPKRNHYEQARVLQTP